MYSQVLKYAWKFRLMKKHHVWWIIGTIILENAYWVDVLNLLFPLPHFSSSALPKTSAQTNIGCFWQEETWATFHVSRGKEEQKDFAIVSLLREMHNTSLSPFKSRKPHQRRSQEMRKSSCLRSNLPPQKASPSSSGDHQVSEREVGLPHSRVKRMLKF